MAKRTVAVFLDRDGVINRKPPAGSYVTSWSEFTFLPGIADAFRLLARERILTIVVTNQRAVARGLLSRQELRAIHDRMCTSIEAEGGHVDALFVCEHDIGSCACRKPAPGLLLQARERFPDIDFARSIVIGDSASDLEAGRALGCRLVLVGDDPYRRQELERLEAKRIAIAGAVPSLLAAVREHVVRSVPAAIG